MIHVNLRTVSIMLALAQLPLSAQSISSVNTRPDRGWSPTGVFSASDLSTVNQVSGNLNVRIPITGLAPDRGGGHAFQLELNYNSSLYDTSPFVTNSAQGIPFVRSPLGASVHGGWNYNYNYGLEYEYRSQIIPSNLCGADPTGWRMYKMYLRTPDGALHLLVPFGLSDTNGDGFFAVGPSRIKSGCPNSEPVPTGDMNYSTVDGTLIRVTIGYSAPPNNPGEQDWRTRQWRAFLPDGGEVRGFAGASDTLIDRNGNEMRIYQFTEANGNVTTAIEDSVGRSIAIEAVLTGSVKTKEIVRKFGFGANSFSWEVIWGKVDVGAKRNSPGDPLTGLSYICGYAPDGGEQYCSLVAALPVVEKLTFPQAIVNNPAYTFDFGYASADSPASGWGELRSVRYPPRTAPLSGATRAEVTFGYRWDNYPATVTAATARNITVGLENAIASRKLQYHDGHAVRAELTTYSFADTSSQMMDAGGLLTTTNFYTRQGFSWTRGLVYQIDEPLGRRVTRQWSRNRIYHYDSANPIVQSESVALPAQNGQPSDKIIRKDFSHDRNGNLRQLTEFDFAGSVARTTIHRYLYPTEAATDTAVTANAGPNQFAYWNPLSVARAIRARFSTEVRAGGPSGVLHGYREFTYDTRWNVIQSSAWDSTRASAPTSFPNVPGQSPAALLNAGNAVVTQTSFANDQGAFQNGNVTAAFDAKGNRTSLVYGVIGGCAGANPTLGNLYPTQRIEAATTTVARTFDLTYDCNTGVVTSERDADNNILSTTTYDGLGRPLTRTEAGLRGSTQTYYDSAYVTVSAQDLAAFGDRSLVTVTHSDDLGRPFLTRSTPDTGTQPAWNDGNPESVGVVVRRLSHPACRVGNPISCNPDPNRYDAVSNPFRVGQSGGEGWTRTRIDTLGRVLDSSSFSGSALPPPWGTNSAVTGVTAYQYDGDLTTVTDPGGKARRQRIDALGRMVAVVEDPSGLNYETTYTYDALDNLTAVTQGSQTRSFVYSSLSRLLSVTNPESGFMSYVYDLNGNLLSKVHQNSVTVTWPTYDALNRVTGKSYSDGTPAVSYVYDTCPSGRGRLCSVGNSTSVMAFEYDALGRAVNSTQTTGLPYLFRYQYNLAGALTSVEYPSATMANPTQPLKVSYTYNQAGRIASVRKGEAQSNDAVVSCASYWANGAPASLQLGNGLLEETTLNSRQQLASVSVRHGSTTLWRSDLTYMTPNNGNLFGQLISGTHSGASLSYSQTYEYDGLNRLRSVLDSGVGAVVDQKSQVFVYDRYGNRAFKDLSYNPGGGVVAVADTAAAVEAAFPGNRLNNCCNAAGDVTVINQRTLTYDGEHLVKQVEFSSGAGPVALKYFYDGEGRRVKSEKWVNGALSTATTFVYDASGQLMAEYTSPTPAGLGRQYLTQDHLGSTRLVTKASGTASDIVYSRHDFLPFGEEIARGTHGYGPSALTMKFTGKERDAETGLDYFGARCMSAAQGRWTSPDIINLTAKRLMNPSNTLNKYVYGANNPLKYVDLEGRDITVFYRRGVFDTGHIQLTALNQNTGKVASLDFVPNQDKVKVIQGTVSGLAIPMRSGSDILSEGYASLTIRTTPEEAQKVIQWIDKFQKETPGFNLLSSNCTTSCITALQILGVDLDPDTINPDTLWDQLFPKYRAESALPTLGHYPSQPGQEYGSPRYPGMTTYGLADLYNRLWLNSMRKEPKACVETSDSATGSKSKQCE